MAHARDFAENVVGRVVSSARRGRLTFVAQMAASDCGPACLAMTLGLFGKRLPLNEIRKVVGPVTGGVTMAQLLTAGSELGLIGRGLRLDLDDLVEMAPGTILHWNMNHFVVLRGATRKMVEVLDPALGVRKLSYEQVGQEFTGVALCFAPSPEFVPERARERPLWPHFKHILVHRKGLIATLLGALAIQTMGLLTPAALAFAVEDLIPWHRKDMLLPLAGALGVSAVFFFWASYVRARILASIHIQVESSLRSGFAYHLLHLPFSFHAEHGTGDIIQRFGSIGRIRETVVGLLLTAGLDAGSAVIFFAVLFAINPTIAIVVLAVALVQVTLTIATRPYRQRLVTEFLAAEGKTISRQAEMLENIYSVKAMGREPALLQRWSNAFVRQLQLRDRMRRLEAFTASAHPAVEILVPIAVIAIGGSAVIEGTMSIGELFAVSTIAPSFVGPVTSLASELEGLITVRGLAVRVNDVLEQESEVHRESAKNKVELRGALRFDAVSFGFGETTVLRDFSLDVRPGSTVALVGHSGSGKSTVVNLLLGMYRPKSGSVLLDDTPLDTLDVLHVRRQMGVVPQTVQVLEGTFRSNITLGAEGHEQNLEWAAWVAMLDERIGRESSGYETPVLEGGASLSGGERQRISLARAVISKPRILILDEATSALDSQTERSVFDRLRQVPCTKIVIAHRLSTIRHADHIVVLDRGRIVEQGTHEQLIGRAGPYTRLLAVDGGAR